MSPTERLEEPLILAALHKEGSRGFLAEKRARLDEIEQQVAETKTAIKDLNTQLGNLLNESWAVYCEIVNVEKK